MTVYIIAFNIFSNAKVGDGNFTGRMIYQALSIFIATAAPKNGPVSILSSGSGHTSGICD
jgi:hypothetical protein